MGTRFERGPLAAGRWLAVGLLSAACLLGCSTTKLTVGAASEKPESRVGVPYPLMYSAFEVEITRRIVGCAKQANVFFKADIKPLGSRPDPAHTYVIDPNSLASWMKTSEVTLAYYPSGAVKSLNAAVEDKTGVVIANVATLLSKVALIGAAPAGDADTYCTEAVNTALKNIGTLNDQVATEQGVVDSLTEDVKALMSKIGGVGNQPDAATRKLLSKRYDALQAARQKLDKLTDDLAKQLKVVTDTERIVWPRDGDELNKSFPLNDGVLRKWLADPAGDSGKFTVSVALTSLSSGNHARDVKVAQTVATSKGVPIRPPVPGVLRVCRGGPCPAEGQDRDFLVSRLDTPVLQLGQVYYLDCTSRPFSSVGCAFELDEAGQLKEIGTKNKAALAEGASAAARSVVEQIATTRAELDGAELKKAQARLAVRKAEADLLAVERSLLPNEVGDKTKVLQAETELAKAEKAKLDADEALRQARLAATGS